MGLLQENALGDLSGNELGQVDGFGNLEVDSDTREGGGFGCSQALDGHQERHDLVDGLLEGAVQVQVDPHQDVVGVGFGPWHRQRFILVQDETESAGQGLLDRGAADLTVTLR
ncbi:MAG: hypothetical protein CL483_06380 [Acidobacteria bacterium]|nr:hypothetical protein [Acidobacteriota bacterium]